MLSRDLWNSVAGRDALRLCPLARVNNSLEIPNHELIDSSALGYVCLEKISGATSASSVPAVPTEGRVTASKSGSSEKQVWLDALFDPMLLSCVASNRFTPQ